MVEVYNKRAISKAFVFINNYYYIDNEEINYTNIKGQHFNKGEEQFHLILQNLLDDKDITFLEQFAFYKGTLPLNDNIIKEIRNVLSKVEQDENFKILPQVLTNTQKQLIDDTKNYIIDYCNDNDIKVLVTYFSAPITYASKEDILKFTIRYNNFDYKYTIRKIDNRIVFKLILRNNKEYRINIYSNTDFDHIVNCMYNDK